MYEVNVACPLKVILFHRRYGVAECLDRLQVAQVAAVCTKPQGNRPALLIVPCSFVMFIM